MVLCTKSDGLDMFDTGSTDVRRPHFPSLPDQAVLVHDCDVRSQPREPSQSC